jgi:hypothetical protein
MAPVLLAAHKLSSGVVTKVAIGTWRDSEVKLARELFAELPQGALLVMDRGFHKPNFLKAAQDAGIHVLVRLKDPKGKKLLGDTSEDCADKVISWTTKDDDGNPFSLNGRIIKFTSQVKGFRSNLFYIFTSDLSLTVDQVADLYSKRAQIEVFIRDIKQRLKLLFIRAKKAENVKKEILLTYLTFNLLRAIMYDTALATNIAVQRLSFTATITLCDAYANAFLSGKESSEQLTEQFRKHLLQAKLPLRKKPRSYPRVIKFPRDKYPAAGIFKPVNTEIGK